MDATVKTVAPPGEGVAADMRCWRTGALPCDNAMGHRPVRTFLLEFATSCSGPRPRSFRPRSYAAEKSGTWTEFALQVRRDTGPDEVRECWIAVPMWRLPVGWTETSARERRGARGQDAGAPCAVDRGS